MREVLIFVLIFCVIMAIVLAPFGFIWSLNTLFKLDIDYTWRTWIASLCLTSLFAQPTIKKNV